MWRELTMPSATPARTVADRCRKATFKAPGSLVRGTVRISTSKPALFWGRQRRKAFQVTKLWSKAMTSKWKYRISVRAVILSLSSYFVFPFVKLGDRLKVGGRVWFSVPDDLSLEEFTTFCSSFSAGA